MINIIFKSIPGKNPHTEIPGLQLKGNYGIFSFGQIPDLANLEFEKFQAAVIEPPELINFTDFLVANDNHELIGTIGLDGEVERHKLTAEELKGTINLFQLLLRKKVDNKFSDRFKATQMNVPLHESQTWEIQKKEAELFKSNPNAPLQLLPVLAETREVSLEKLVDLILNKVKSYTQAIGNLLGMQQNLRDKVKRATTLKELRKVEGEIEAS